jgi:rubrerythrin
MSEDSVNCQHACKNTCATLNEALRKETAMVKYYEGVLDECNIPEVKTFMDELVEEKRKIILRLIQKLNEIHVRSQAIDGITSSFNNIDG